MMKSSKNQLIDREPAVAGQFYNESAYALKEELHQLFQKAQPKESLSDLQALIVPHAGYMFSGEIAAAAYKLLDPSKHYRRIFLIGSSHHHHFEGASIYTQGHYKTPLGKVEVDLELAQKLIEPHHPFEFHPEAHLREHTIEVQLPFLQYRLKHDFKIVPILMGTHNREICHEIGNLLRPWFGGENLFVISTDFSHYPSYEDAYKVDKETAEAIITNNPDTLQKALLDHAKQNIPHLATSLCGWTAVQTLLHLTHSVEGVKYHLINYRNSGDQDPYHNHHRVVGYYAIGVTWKPSHQKMALTKEEEQELLNLSRKAINNLFEPKSSQAEEPPSVSPNLLTSSGLFISLYHHNKLRGCIGTFHSDEPLYMAVQNMTRSAAINDKRFDSITEEEIPDIEIEISILSPLKPITNPNEIQLGKHGIYLRYGIQSGTFLPQVAQKTGWDLEEFLGYCARDKAGIGWDGWRDADLFIYEAHVFSTRKPSNQKPSGPQHP